MKEKNTISLNGNFESFGEISNSTFIKTRLKVFALGRNFNGSNILKEGFKKAENSLRLIPIVAKYTTDSDVYLNEGDLTGHNVELSTDKNGEVMLKYDTYPIGVISNTSNFTIEEVNEGTDEEPIIKEYIVADEVYLWKRYEATQKIQEWLGQGIMPKVSMEIGSVSGYVGEDNYFHIEDYEFEAVCVLGSDTTPCFPRAEITSYTRNEFKDELKELVFELNKTLSDEPKGGNNQMAKEIKQEKTQEADDVKVVSNYEKEVVDTTAESSAEPVSEATDTVANEVSETKTETTESTALTETENTSQTDESPANIESSTENLDTFKNELSKKEIEVVTENVEVADETVTISNGESSIELSKEGVKLKGHKITVQEDLEEDYQAKYRETSTELDTLKIDYNTLQSELAELQSYKRQREEDDLKAKFEGKLSDEEFTQVFTEMKESGLDKVEEKLFALIGKKNFSIESTKTNTKIKKVSIVAPKEIEENPYGSIFD